MNYVDLLKRTVTAFNDDKAQRLAAALAFSTIFAIAPLFVILIAVIGSILGIDGSGGHTAAENTLLDEVSRNTGAASAETVRKLIDASFSKHRQGVLAQTIGWVAFAFTASNLFASLQDALNAVWHVEATKGGWQQMLRVRARSFSMIAIIGLLLFATLVANAVITFVGAHFLAAIPFAKSPVVLTLVEQGVSLLLTAVAFALLFKVLPDVKVAWRDVFVGSVVTAFLFIAGEALISLYIAYGGVASAYGAAGSLLVVLVWIYYSALILMAGAEFTKVYATRAELTVPATVRELTDRPAGADPRVVEREPDRQSDGTNA